jgi:ribosomal protein S18 acetylase RimI-like enzyme
MVSPQNPPAIAMYQRAGFKTAGETDMYGIHFICKELAL